MRASAVERSSQGNHEHTRFAVIALFDTQAHESNCCVLTTQQCTRNNGTYQSCSAVHKQTHIDGILFYYAVC